MKRARVVVGLEGSIDIPNVIEVVDYDGKSLELVMAEAVIRFLVSTNHGDVSDHVESMHAAMLLTKADGREVFFVLTFYDNAHGFRVSYNEDGDDYTIEHIVDDECGGDAAKIRVLADEWDPDPSERARLLTLTKEQLVDTCMRLEARAERLFLWA